MCVRGRGGEAEGGRWRGGEGVSCVCALANVYVCICHSCDGKKIFLASKNKNKVLKSSVFPAVLDLKSGK